MNQVILIGNSGSDVELRYAQNGTAIANVSLATSEKKGEQWESTWHRIVLFGKMAESMAPRIKKGSQLFVQGKIQNREWEKNGVKQRSTDIVAFTVKIIEKQTTTTDAYAGQSFGDSDIPF